MVRTQIQLTEYQFHTLKALASEQEVSMAELIRRSVDNFLQSFKEPTLDEKQRNALSVIGILSSEETDISTNHDKYLAEVYAEVG